MQMQEYVSSRSMLAVSLAIETQDLFVAPHLQTHRRERVRLCKSAIDTIKCVNIEHSSRLATNKFVREP
jgi:hypothetical protein